MGTAIWCSGSKMHIAKNQQAGALKALQELRESSVNVLEATTLQEALGAWGFEVKVDRQGTLSHFDYEGDKRDFSPIVPALAPYVREGSYLEVAVENEGSAFITVFTFKNGTIQEEAFIEYAEEGYRVPVGDKNKASVVKEKMDWYSEQLHFKYSGDMYRIVSWASSDGAIARAKKQVAKGLEYGKDSADYLQWDYEYNESVLAEKIHKEIKNEKGKLQVVITENRYEALCLNTPNTIFIDLDKPKGAEKQPYKTWIKESVAQYFSTHPEQSGILYETAEGMRLVFTHQLMSVKKAYEQGYFNFTYCDPRYLKMCLVQACFRARLTPKPWREEKAKGEKLAVCRKVKIFNEEKYSDDPEINAVIKLHDEYCLRDEFTVLV